MVNLNVVSNQEKLALKDLTIYEGENWKVEDHFTSATDKDGANIELKDLIVEGIEEVDPTTAGTYTIKIINGGISKTATLKVIENETAIEAKDSTIHLRTTWNPVDNFVSATSKEGYAINFNKVKVTEVDQVDPSKVG